MKYFYTLLIILLIVSCNNDVILNPSENFSNVDIIDIYADEEDLITLLSNRMYNTEISVILFYKGEKYNALLRSSGAGSRYHSKWSYRVILNGNKFIEGIREFNLSAQIFDKTFLSTTIATKIYRDNGFILFDSKHVFLRINDEEKGLYLLIEKIDEDFFSRRNKKVNELFKLNFNADFTFNNPNYPELTFDKEIPNDENFNSISDFIYAVDTSQNDRIYSSLGKFLDIDNYLNYHAITTIINNSDAFRNNFYFLKQEPQSPFKIMPWDFDKVFEEASAINSIYGYNALIVKLLSAESTRNKYLDIFEEKLNILDMNYLNNVIDSTSNKIREAYNADPYLGKGRYNFDAEINSLKNFINNRKVLLKSLLDEYR